MVEDLIRVNWATISVKPKKINHGSLPANDNKKEKVKDKKEVPRNGLKDIRGQVEGHD